MIRDLHTHTTASDGAFSPLALYEAAAEAGISELALTDHDTVAGFKALRDYLSEKEVEGPKLIPGIEFSSLWGTLGLHIVGLNIDVEHAGLTAVIEEQQKVRAERAEEIALRLAKIGIVGALEGAKRFAPGEQLGRPHFADFLVAEGYVKNQKAAFKKYLGSGKIGDVKNVWPGYDQVIGWIREAGGVAVIAHPMHYKISRKRRACLAENFAEAGGQGIEISVPGTTEPERRYLAALASECDLAASAGSDFHAPKGTWQQLGKVPALPEGCVPVWELWE